LPVTISEKGDERIPLVPQRISAGYTEGYSDSEFIEQLPQFNLPFPEMHSGRTYRLFQTKGDSMLPVPSGAYIISEYLEDWRDLKNGNRYVIVSKDEGIVFKRAQNYLHKGYLELHSDNKSYQPYSIEAENIFEIWKALGFISFEWPENESGSSEFEITTLVTQLKKEVDRLKQV